MTSSWQTHRVFNQSTPLSDIDLFSTDRALTEAVMRFGAAWALDALKLTGSELGSSESFERGRLANEYPPRLRSYDSKGHRIDALEFHPAWHELMSAIFRRGLHSAPWADPKPGAHVARAAGFYLQTQVEAGSLCPTTMTYGAIPALAKHEHLAREWLPTLFSREYDRADRPLTEKRGGLIGMGMTEKQGGSDVRANTTVAVADEQAWRLTGHKWFFSAPQCDAHLVLAQAPGGLSCFFVPRWQPDGTRNAIRIQRLKDKLGNKSNASSEVEFQDAYGVLLGEEGRGIPTILEMGTYTRLDCILGSSGMMRQALVQGLHHASERSTFGKRLIEHDLMRNVLADLALETEAATHFSLFLASAFDRQDDPEAIVLRRLLTPAGKYWVCKRGPELAAEAMEVMGGNGYVEDGIHARIYREMPVNSIWEGSGNIMALDVLRALARTPDAVAVLTEILAPARGASADFDRFVTRLPGRLTRADETTARRLTQDLVLAVQASLLLQYAPAPIADAFCRSRLAGDWGSCFGTLPSGCDFAAILERAGSF